jgi:hypothetical protein
MNNDDKFCLIIISDRPEVKNAALEALYQKESENKLHHFTEANRADHLSNWQ